MLMRLVRRSLLHDTRNFAWMLASLATCSLLVTLFAVTAVGSGRQMRSTLRRLGANAVIAPASSTMGDGAAGLSWSRVGEELDRGGFPWVLLQMRTGTVSGRTVAIVAADPEPLALLTPYWDIRGHRPSGLGECLLGARLARILDRKVGDAINAGVSSSRTPTAWRVTGIASTGDEDDDRVYVVPAAFRGSTVAISAATGTLALLSVPGDMPALRRLEDSLRSTGLGVEIEPLRQILHGEETILKRITLLTGASLAAVFLLTALGMTASMLARMAERRKEFALMRALGAEGGEVARFILAESALLGGLASLFGYALGTGSSLWLFRRVFHVGIAPQLLPFVAAFLLTTGVAVVAGMVGASRALKQRPATALRGE